MNKKTCTIAILAAALIVGSVPTTGTISASTRGTIVKTTNKKATKYRIKNTKVKQVKLSTTKKGRRVTIKNLQSLKKYSKQTIMVKKQVVVRQGKKNVTYYAAKFGKKNGYVKTTDLKKVAAKKKAVRTTGKNQVTKTKKISSRKLITKVKKGQLYKFSGKNVKKTFKFKKSGNLKSYQHTVWTVKQLITVRKSNGQKQQYYKLSGNRYVAINQMTKAVNKVTKTKNISNRKTLLVSNATVNKFSGSIKKSFTMKKAGKATRGAKQRFTIRKQVTVNQTNKKNATYYEVKQDGTSLVGYVPTSALQAQYTKSATTTTMTTNPLANYALSKVPTVNNSNAPAFVKAPNNFKDYATSANYGDNAHTESVANVYTSKKNINASRMTLTTEFFLPIASAENDKYSTGSTGNGVGNYNGFDNVQSLAYDQSRYLYAMVSYDAGNNQGRIMRYDYSAMKAAGLDTTANFAKLRQIAYNLYYIARYGNDKNGKYAVSDADRASYNQWVKVGPLITIGHGQALAYNPKDGHLWMYLDKQNKDKSYTETKSVLQRINMTSLKADYTINYTTKNSSGTVIPPLHNLAFDNSGNFYSYSYSDSSIKIYRGQILDDNVVQLSLAQVIKNSIGTCKQGLMLDLQNQKMYIESDDALMSMPLGKVGGLAKKDLSYWTFKSGSGTYGREWEGGFFAKGQGHFLMNKGVEILQASFN
ncbi:hypothetical protein EQG49_03685 [Periweissella cryptocerci]|uniref:Extracellular protein n=1 Tax=Periweissella cryptocerci TaxID=2506420 RepID=A0A4P6YSL0_9LACO|nr:hypothetical protein [Periweissella cryptocerci]QBO35622.1 hypothetical protein EQG49_03685 [Periweissella cryptocerci]